MRVVREGACGIVKTVVDQKQPVEDFFATGKAHSQCKTIRIIKEPLRDSLFPFASIALFDYLNEPSNGVHRVGAIAVGTLSGYIISIRRGFFRRLLYTSVGGLGVASLCYPKEAAVYSQQALTEAKVYATILYNFAYGGKYGLLTNNPIHFDHFIHTLCALFTAVKPGDDPKPLPVPSTLKEFYGSICGLLFSSKKDEK